MTTPKVRLFKDQKLKIEASHAPVPRRGTDDNSPVTFPRRACALRNKCRVTNKNDPSAPLRCARAFGRAEGSFLFVTRHLFLSAQARLGNVTGLLSSVPRRGTVA